MARKRIIYSISFLIIVTLCLSACTSKEQTLQGKYIFTVDGSDTYYNFVDDTNYTTNDFWDDWDINDSGTGTYIIDGSKITLYINGDENIRHEIGYIYKNYIGFWCEGEFPSKNNKTTEIAVILSEYACFKYRFKEDGTYEYIVLSNNKFTTVNVGTYSVSNKVLTCTNDKGEVRTFLNTKDGVFCISYVKE